MENASRKKKKKDITNKTQANMQMKLEGGGVEGEHNTHCFQTHTNTFMQTYSSKGAER